MSDLLFGIDCATDQSVAEADRVSTAIAPVRWVGRYLPVFPLTGAEAAAHHGADRAIACIDNHDQTGAEMAEGFQAGYDTGLASARAWRALGAPEGVHVYLDVETGFWLSPAYLAGYAEGHAAGGTTGCVYLNPIGGNGHNESYARARAMTELVIPIFSCQGQEEPPVPGAFTPAAPPGFEGAVELWQYHVLFGNADLDVATPAGYAGMWQARKPVTTLGVDVALKVLPNHVCPARADLAAGCVVTFDGPDGKPLGLTPHWARVQVLSGATQKGHPAAGLVGWVLRADLKTA